jgi:hypothetical protein
MGLLNHDTASDLLIYLYIADELGIVERVIGILMEFLGEVALSFEDWVG